MVATARVAELVDLPAACLPVGRAGRRATKKYKSMYKVYALKSLKRNYIYVGLTSDLPRRLAQHNNGHEKTTRSYAPFILIYHEAHNTRLEARNREKYLKSGVGKEYLKSLV
jgi:putative endonuclease